MSDTRKADYAAFFNELGNLFAGLEGDEFVTGCNEAINRSRQAANNCSGEEMPIFGQALREFVDSPNGKLLMFYLSESDMPKANGTKPKTKQRSIR